MTKSLLALAAMAAISVAAIAQDTVSAMPQKQLLAGYWKCFDISDSTEKKGEIAFPETDIAVCTQISKAVQVRYFDDDFGRLHAWTNANRTKAPLTIKK